MSNSSPQDEIREYCTKRGISERVSDGGAEYLMCRWEAAVIRAEKPTTIIYEFLNDLDTRQILHELAPMMSDEDWSKIETRLKVADERMKSLTVPVETCLKRGGISGNLVLHSETHWWYFRLPKFLR